MSPYLLLNGVPLCLHAVSFPFFSSWHSPLDEQLFWTTWWKHEGLDVSLISLAWRYSRSWDFWNIWWFKFNFLRQLYTVVCNCCLISTLTNMYQGFLFPKYCHQHCYYWSFLIITNLTGVRWCIPVILIFFSLRIMAVEHFCMYLSFIFLSS